MNDEELKNDVKKILNKTLPKEFEFIEGVKDLHFTSGTYSSIFKIKIILNKDWVESNFDSEALEYISQDLENFGHSLLSPFTLYIYSAREIDTDKVDEYIHTVLTFLGNTPDIFATSYIVE